MKTSPRTYVSAERHLVHSSRRQRGLRKKPEVRIRMYARERRKAPGTKYTCAPWAEAKKRTSPKANELATSRFYHTHSDPSATMRGLPDVLESTIRVTCIVKVILILHLFFSSSESHACSSQTGASSSTFGVRKIIVLHCFLLCHSSKK